MIEIKELTHENRLDIKKIIDSRDHIFSNHEFNFDNFFNLISSEGQFNNKEIINLGLFEDEVRERFAILYIKEELGITMFLCSLKKEKNTEWHKNYDLFVNKIFDIYLEKGVKKVYYLTSKYFKDETKNPDITNFSKFKINSYDFPANKKYTGENEEYLNKYVIGDNVYQEDLIIREFIL